MNTASQTVMGSLELTEISSTQGPRMSVGAQLGSSGGGPGQKVGVLGAQIPNSGNSIVRSSVNRKQAQW